MVQLMGESRIADSRSGTVHAKGTVALTDLRASKIQKFPGGMPPVNF